MTGAIGIAYRVQPGGSDLLHGHAHSQGVNSRRGGECAGNDRHFKRSAIASDNIGENEGAPFVFGDSTLKLPARERMQFRILVDWPVHTHNKSARLKRREMRLKIRRRSCHLR